MKTSDLLGSEKISGQTRQNPDSLLEQSLNGKERSNFKTGTKELFLRLVMRSLFREFAIGMGAILGLGIALGRSYRRKQGAEHIALNIEHTPVIFIIC
jgi:hypothetical protein